VIRYRAPAPPGTLPVTFLVILLVTPLHRGSSFWTTYSHGTLSYLYPQSIVNAQLSTVHVNKSAMYRLSFRKWHWWFASITSFSIEPRSPREGHAALHSIDPCCINRRWWVHKMRFLMQCLVLFPWRETEQK
jgi:hypothetical protein